MKALLFHPEAEGQAEMKKSNLKLLFKRLFDAAIADMIELHCCPVKIERLVRPLPPSF